MTLEGWLSSLSTSEIHSHLCELPNRKLHLLTAAILRRAWEGLPSGHTRAAVEATEQFVDGLVSAKQLARLRSTDLLESCEALWLEPHHGGYDEQLIGLGCLGCSICDARAAEYECRAAKSGGVLSGVKQGVEEPVWIAVQAILRAREIAAWKANPERRTVAEQDESRAQYDLFREIAGPEVINPRWPRWRSTDVRALARCIHRDQAHGLLPILADALQDAGCNDEEVLSHCRDANGRHVRGCWVVDLALGIG